MAKIDDRTLKRIPVLVFVLLSAGLILIAAALTFPGSFGITTTQRIVGISSSNGFLLTAKLPLGISSQRGREILFPDSPILFEDGKALGRPGASSKEIANAGRGRYQISGTKIDFSTTDGGPKATRVFTICSPLWSLPEPLLLAVWIFGLAAAAISVRLVYPLGMERLFQRPSVAFGTFFFSLALVGVFCCFRSTFSDGFFLGLLLPTVWAGLMGVNSVQRHVAGKFGVVILALLPGIAGFYYYGLNAASDSSFLVAGIIPCSDARMHFQQAAEIALQGTTEQMFNGRFFYPAFFAVLLKAAGLNIIVANLLVSTLVMLGFVFTCWPVAKRVGSVGAAIYCLLFWLYFRAHGCGLLMTENLGLLFGVLGFGFLLFSVDGDKIWPTFVAVVFFGLGSAARPGALFILPVLVFYVGIRVWIRNAGRCRTFRASWTAAAILLGFAITFGCFGANHLVMKSLCRGEAKPFGNFAFTLHGLLNNTKWSTSANDSGWNAALVMEQNIRQIKESPASLVYGVARAYGEAWKKRFLFRFGSEKRLATTGMALFLLASLVCWLWKPLRRDSAWILLLFVGIIASIPFAPPWDAGERPYAVTVPVQVFLAAVGFAMLSDLLRRFAAAVVSWGHAAHFAELDGPQPATPNTASSSCMGILPTRDLPSKGRMPMPQFLAKMTRTGGTLEPPVFCGANGIAFIVFAALCLFLVFPAPLLLRFVDVSHPQEAFLPGSRLQVPQGLSLANYLDRLSDYQASYPENARFFTADAGDFLLAINWNDLQTVLLPCPPAQDFSR